MPSHPRFREPLLLAISLLLAVSGAVIGMQIVATLGVTPNTSIVGVMVAILLVRIPLGAFRGFRSVHRQNLVQTTISSATFGAANFLLVPLGVPVVLGMPELVVPMLVGAAAGMLIDLAMLYWFFDSKSVQVTRITWDHYESDPDRGFYGGGGLDCRFFQFPIL